MTTKQQLKRGALALFILSITSLALVGRAWGTHGLQRTHSGPDEYVRTGLWLWPTVEGDEFTTEDGFARVDTLQMQGYVWQGAAGSTTWQVQHSGNLTIWVDEQEVFAVEGWNALRTDAITVQWDGPALHLRIEMTVDINTPRTRFPYRTEMGIHARDAWGQWRLLPVERLYPELPSAAQAERTLQLAFMTQILVLVSVVSAALWLVLWSWERRWWRSSFTWGVVGVVLLTVIVRGLVLLDRAANDPFLYFLVPGGDDNYVLMGQQLLSGQYTLAGTFWPAGPIVWFAGVVSLLGPQLSKVALASLCLSALTAGLVTLTGRALTQSRAVGLVSGTVLALYPPLVFYQGTAQSVVLDAALLALAIYLGVLAVQQRSYRHAALFGIAISLGAYSRGTALLLGPALFLALLTRKGWGQGLRLTVVAATCAVLTLLPQTLATALATGHLSLVPYSNGSLTLYSGNNRDADGLWTGRGPAWELERISDEAYTEALLRDLGADPLRVVALNLRKWGMFWNNFEYVSNVNYQQQALDASPLLRGIALDGRLGMATLSFFAWVGLLLLLRQRDAASRFFVLSTLALVAGTALFVLAGRLRVPVVPLLSVAAGFSLVTLVQTVRQAELRRPWLLAAGGAALLLALFSWFDWNLPPKTSIAPNAQTIARPVAFDDGVRLLGFDSVRTDYRAGGYVYLTLYWEVLATAPDGANVIVEVADERGRIVGIDQPLGHMTYPPVNLGELATGHILQEGYLLRLPDEMPSVVQVQVGLRVGDALLPSTEQEAALLHLFDLGIADTLPPTAPPTPQAIFGEALAVSETSVRSAAAAITVTATWTAQQPLYENVVIFTHLLDADGQLVAQVDSPSLDDLRSTSALIPGYPVQMTRTIALPDALPSGTYTVVLGAYRFPSLERLVVLTAAGERPSNDALPMGTVTLPER